MKATVKAITRENLFWRPYENWKHLDGKLRPQFNLTSTRTRRPTGSMPNFLQLPKGSLVRGNVKAPEGYLVIAPDWSAEEMRLVADESKCPNMLSAFIGDNKKDIHSIMGAAIAPFMYTSVCPSLLKKVKYVLIKGVQTQDYDQYMEWRSYPSDTDEYIYSNLIRKARAKNLGFLALFGGTAYSAVAQLLITMEEAEKLIDLQGVALPGLKPWHERILREINSKCYMLDAFGQRYHYPKRPSKGYSSREVRQSCNNYAQGAATAILHLTGKAFHDRRLYERYGAYILAPIYDELICIVKNDSNLYEVLNEIRDSMTITPPGHTISQIPEFEIYLPSDDGISRWSINGVELSQEFTKEEVFNLTK